MRHTLLDRLEKLERHPRLQPPPPLSAAELLFQEKLHELLGQMDQKYAKLFARTCDAEGLGLRSPWPSLADWSITWERVPHWPFR
jgi:hypothetical protein